MFLVGPYLFSGEELEAYLGARKTAALEAVGAVGADDIASQGRNNLIRSLYARYQVPETHLHVDQAYFVEERQLTGEERTAIGVKPDDDTVYKAVSIAIPFSGDEHLLICTPAIFSAHQPQARVADGVVHVTYFFAEVEEFHLENNFKRLIALIERTLEVTQWQAMTYNEQLMDAITAAIDARVGA